MTGVLFISIVRKLSIGAVTALCLLGFARESRADANIVVLNSTSGDITVSCNATGTISAGSGGWSCVDAKIITKSGDTYSVKDTHGHEGCKGGAWSIRYSHDNDGKLMKNACTPLGVGQIACHIVQVTDQGLRVDVQDNNNACAGHHVTQFGPKILKELENLAASAPIVMK